MPETAGQGERVRGPVSMWKQVLLSALLLGGAAALWFWQEAALDWFGYAAAPEARQAEQRDPGVPVIVAPVAKARDDLVLEAVGTGRARHSVTLRTEVAGKVAEVTLAPGKRFEEGDVTLRLDDTRQRLALSLAETRLAEAERAVARYERLQGTGAAAAVTLDQAQTEAEIARIEVERAREELADRTLRAPFDGVSGLPAVEAGDWVDSGDEVASFDDRSVILVEFDLPEAYLARVEEGMAVTARTPAVPGASFEGNVAAIDSRVDPVSRTARVRVAIPNPDDRLRPGASFTIRLELPGGAYPVVPELAVQFSRGSLFVWRISDGAAEQVAVELVRRRAGSVLVDGPLAEGDPVVVEGTQRLSPGEAVNVIGGDGGRTS